MLEVIEVTSDSIQIVHDIQRNSFMPLLKKYEDYDISPAMESIESIKYKMDNPCTKSYLFSVNSINVGWVRITELEENSYKISALCVLPEYQNQGIAQKALKEIENYYPNANKWSLETIVQEKWNCHLYEKLGYCKTGDLIPINERMDLIIYTKEK